MVATTERLNLILQIDEGKAQTQFAGSGPRTVKVTLNAMLVALAPLLRGIEETQHYHMFPREHWRSWRTNIL